MTRRVVAATARAVILMAMFVVGASAVADAQGHTHPPARREIAAASVATSADSSAAMGMVPLFDGLGTFGRRGDTTDPTVQRYIDQGWRLAYGFAREAAVASFAEAARRDSVCAMCWWGVAWAAGPYFNDPEPSPAALRRAAEAAARAWRLRARVRAGDRSLIEAMHVRF
ncbi:MAG: hypothetical protein MUF53_10340, partial [Gemmatimonadaceae bacterium]|nr:hypothetical protein [Gemmatimonadaceae bacterium]